MRRKHVIEIPCLLIVFLCLMFSIWGWSLVTLPQPEDVLSQMDYSLQALNVFICLVAVVEVFIGYFYAEFKYFSKCKVELVFEKIMVNVHIDSSLLLSKINTKYEPSAVYNIGSEALLVSGKNRPFLI